MDASATSDSNTVLNSIRERLARGVPTGWRLTTLGECFKWSSGGTPRRTVPDYFGGGIPWAVIGDLNDNVITETQSSITQAGLLNSSAKWVEPGSVLVAMYGSIGKLAIAGRRLTTNQAIAFAKPDPVEPKYLYYYLLWQRPSLARLGKGATQLNISQTVLKQFPFLLPPQDEQRRIVAEIEKQFSRLDEAVANLKRVKATLKSYKAAVLKAAVEGRLVPNEVEVARNEGRTCELGEQLLDRIREDRSTERTERKRRSENCSASHRLAQLPKGWVWTTYQQVGRLQLGRQRAPKFHTGPNMRPYLRVQNVFEDRLDLSDVMQMDFPPADFEKYALAPGDLLLNEGQSPELLGRPAIYRGELPGACFTNTLIRFQARDGVRVEFALLVARHHMHSGRFVDEGAITTNIAHLSVGRLASVEFPLPPAAEQDRIVQETDRQLSIAGSLERSEMLAGIQVSTLRASILQYAFLITPRGGRSEPTRCT